MSVSIFWRKDKGLCYSRLGEINDEYAANKATDK